MTRMIIIIIISEQIEEGFTHKNWKSKPKSDRFGSLARKSSKLLSSQQHVVCVQVRYQITHLRYVEVHPEMRVLHPSFPPYTTRLSNLKKVTGNQIFNSSSYYRETLIIDAPWEMDCNCA